MKRLFVFRHRLALSALAFALLLGSGVSVRESLQTFAKVLTQSAEAESLGTPQGNTRRDRVEAEVITIHSNGFRPSQITRPRGWFLILVDNRSDSDELTLRLGNVAGPLRREVRQTRENKIVKHLEDLPAGEYLLTEASHPDWVCRITITPN